MHFFLPIGWMIRHEVSHEKLEILLIHVAAHDGGRRHMAARSLEEMSGLWWKSSAKCGSSATILASRKGPMESGPRAASAPENAPRWARSGRPSAMAPSAPATAGRSRFSG
eukprot:6168334-Pyramimonas_sp.AAC.2